MNKYATQSKTKEVSALREEAFRLHEARKYYIHMSGQHVVRMLHFRSDLEHTLVDLFSGATMAHLNDFGGGVQVWQKLDHQLASWKQWIVDVNAEKNPKNGKNDKIRGTDHVICHTNIGQGYVQLPAAQTPNDATGA